MLVETGTDAAADPAPAPAPTSAPTRRLRGPTRMPPVPATDYNSATIRLAIKRERAERRARYRAGWWFPLFVLLIGLSGCWGLLKADQLVAEELIWPSRGAQFVEVGPVPADPSATGGRLTIVVGGLNQKSGTGPAAALMPALSQGHTRVFSLIYGSGINDQDIIEKYDALIGQYRPREINFFGSSMGGDVVLNLAGHAQQRRDDYRQDLLAGTDAPAPNPVGATGSTTTGAGAENAGIAAPAGPAADAGPTPGATGLADTTPTGSTADAGTMTSGGATALAETTTTDGNPVVQAPASGQEPRTVGGSVSRIIGLLITTDSQASAGLGTAGAGALTGRPGQIEPASAAAADEPAVPPLLGTIYLDCSPLGVTDVRDVSRTQADALTGLTEALHTDGGAAVRMTAEMLAQQNQWSTGRFPFLQVRPDDMRYKFTQVWRDKIGAPGISTQLIKDQYGVIRRLDIDDIAKTLGPGTRIVYFRPENPADDHTVRVDQVETTLRQLATDNRLDLRVVLIPGGHHASAANNSDTYRSAITAINGGGT